MDILPRFSVALPAQPRNRLTVLARPLLILPHVILVGGPLFGIMGMGFYRIGALGMVAWLVAVLDWFGILFNLGPVAKLQFLKHLYLTWKARVLAYGGFLCDEYPPFGEGAYPASLALPPEPAQRDKVTVLLRPILLFPHILWLTLLVLAWSLVMVFVWIWLPFTGSMPDSLWRFSRDVMAYSLRVEAYGLLFHDEFPAFAGFQGAGEE